MPKRRKRKKGVAKRPPPKDRDPYGPVLENVDGRRKKELLALRHAANIRYITSHPGISLKKLSEQKPFAGNVSHETIRKCSIKKGWLAQRAKYFEGIRDEIKKKLGKRIADIMVEQLNEVDKLFRSTLNKIGASEPKSMEGLINALVNLMKAGNELREKIAKDLIPERLVGVQDEGMQVTPKLTEEEARAAAMAIIHKRRAEMRRQAGTEGSGEKPHLRVVEGGADGADGADHG